MRQLLTMCVKSSCLVLCALLLSGCSGYWELGGTWVHYLPGSNGDTQKMTFKIDKVNMTWVETMELEGTRGYVELKVKYDINGQYAVNTEASPHRVDITVTGFDLSYEVLAGSLTDEEESENEEFIREMEQDFPKLLRGIYNRNGDVLQFDFSAAAYPKSLDDATVYTKEGLF